MTFAVVSERAGAIVVLLDSSLTNVDGDTNTTLSLPPGFGDCFVLGAFVRGTAIATMVANPELVGPALRIEAAGNTGHADLLGEGRWNKISATRLLASVVPWGAVYMGGQEVLDVSWAEVDTNAVPTVDFEVMLRVRRLRDVRDRRMSLAEIGRVIKV